MWASFLENLEVVKELVADGADLNTKDYVGICAGGGGRGLGTSTYEFIFSSSVCKYE